jgi:hypothetical protein
MAAVASAHSVRRPFANIHPLPAVESSVCRPAAVTQRRCPESQRPQTSFLWALLRALSAMPA